MRPKQADNEIEEENLLNFVVNSLNDELPIDLGENVEVMIEKLHKVPADEVTFPVFIDCVYQQGRYDEHRVAHHGYSVGHKYDNALVGGTAVSDSLLSNEQQFYCKGCDRH